MTNPSNIIDFSQYMPPGVYMNPVAGPQLAVNSTIPTAVAIIGQTVGYQTYTQTVQINPDLGVSPSITVEENTAGQAGLSDVQTVTITGSPTGGTFTLTFGGETTSGLAYDAAASDVQTALQALASIGAGGATVSGSVGGPYTITFTGSLSDAPQAVITADGSGLTGGSPGVGVVHTTTGVLPIDEVQTITVTATAGSFTLTFGAITTGSFAYNAAASTVQSGLQGLSSIGAGNATVAGSNGGPYTVTFTGALAGAPQALLVSTASGTTPSPTQTLTYQGINTASVTVINPSSLAPYVVGTDYTIVTISGTTGTSNAQYAIERVIGGHIDPGDYIQVSYQYTDPTYYTPQLFYTYTDVTTFYGQPFDTTTGTIQSGLSLMAKFAFLNGAYNVLCCAVQSSTTPGNATVGDYGNALNQLENQVLVAVVVADTGVQPLQQLIQEHVDQQSANRFERRAICGLDGTVVAVPSSQRIVDAQAITDSRVALVCPATFTYWSPELNGPVILGGQYISACLAAITVAQGFEMPLTRKTITGFIAVTEVEAEGQKTMESQNGLMVIEQTRTGQIQVRHGLSTDPTSLLTREWSIIGQQDAMVYTLRDYLESDNLIGQPIYPYTLTNVKGSAEAALQSLIVNGLIVDYTGLSVRQLLTNPDVLEVSFNWLPAFPLNYIVCTFTVSVTSGNLTSSTGTTSNQANVTSTGQTSTTAIGVPSSSSINDFGGASNTAQST